MNISRTEHHSTDRLKERGVEKGYSRRSALPGLAHLCSAVVPPFQDWHICVQLSFRPSRTGTPVFSLRSTLPGLAHLCSVVVPPFQDWHICVQLSFHPSRTGTSVFSCSALPGLAHLCSARGTSTAWKVTLVRLLRGGPERVCVNVCVWGGGGGGRVGGLSGRCETTLSRTKSVT